MQTIFSFLPKNISDLIHQMPPRTLDKVEEIRIRIGRPIEISTGSDFEFLPFIVTEEEASQILSRITKFSMYTMEEELKRGYITIEGGHRVGIAGKVILDGSNVKAIVHISSYNIRIAREKIGCAEGLIRYLYDNGWKNTMIIGPPQSGKTTMLRDLARIISQGEDRRARRALKVGIIDERSEIAGCVNGVPQLRFGNRVDVLDACPKAEGMMMMIRSMSPDVIVADEIGRSEDADAVIEAIHAGIKLFTTTHGYSFEEVLKRPIIQKVMGYQAFDRFVVLRRDNKRGFHYTVTNHNGEPLRIERGIT